ncbi:MAG: hypothetical protein ACT4OS_01675 [Acidimicrobiales bacterium]
MTAAAGVGAVIAIGVVWAGFRDSPRSEGGIEARLAGQAASAGLVGGRDSDPGAGEVVSTLASDQDPATQDPATQDSAAVAAGGPGRPRVDPPASARPASTPPSPVDNPLRTPPESEGTSDGAGDNDRNSESPDEVPDVPGDGSDPLAGKDPPGRAPSGVALSRTGTQSARVSWADNSTREKGFEVEIEGSIDRAGANATSLAVATSKVPTEGSVCGRVRAFNDAGPGPWSNQACSGG